MIVNEIFGSIDGEGLRTGELTTFVRLAGCNLQCSYCDTTYSQNSGDGDEMSIEEILSKVESIGFHNITLTGGEPLIHKDIEKLVDCLIQKKYHVNIETNGSAKIDKYIKKNCLITLDNKTPSSGMNLFMLKENLSLLRENDVLKIVVAKCDFNYVENFLKENKVKSWIYLSPVFSKVNASEIVDFLKFLNKNNFDTKKIRVQVQLHKVIWNPAQRSV